MMECIYDTTQINLITTQGDGNIKNSKFANYFFAQSNTTSLLWGEWAEKPVSDWTDRKNIGFAFPNETKNCLD